MNEDSRAEEIVASLTAEVRALEAAQCWEDSTTKAAEALRIAEEAFGSEDVRTARSLASASWNAYVRSRYEEAVAASRRALAICEAKLPPNDAETIRNRMDLSCCLFKLAGDRRDGAAREATYGESCAEADRALAACEAAGRDDLEFADFLLAAGYQRHWIGLYTDADPMLQRGFALRERTAGLGDPRTAEAAVRLALNCWRLGASAAEVLPLYRKALAGYEEAHPDEHPDVLDARFRLAQNLSEAGCEDEAAEHFDRIVSGLLAPTSRLVEDDSPWYLNACADYLRAAGRESELAELERRAGAYRSMVQPGMDTVAAAERRYGADSVEAAQALMTLGSWYIDEGDVEPAVEVARRALAILTARLGPEGPETRKAMERLEKLRSIDAEAARTPRPPRRLGTEEPKLFGMFSTPWADERREDLIRSFLAARADGESEDDPTGALGSVMALTFMADADEQWLFILELIAAAPDDPCVLQAIAAGPLEGFLGRFDAEVIDRVEAEAERDPRFRRVLSGVWKHGMSDAVWARVRNIQKSVTDALPEMRPFEET